MKKLILGISAYYHDSAAALIEDGKIIAAAQEERFTRQKHDSSFPKNAIQFILDFREISIDQINAVVFYDKPFLKFERLMSTYHAFAPSGLQSFSQFLPQWVREKIFIRPILKKEISYFGTCPPLFFTEHHLSHAASAFYPSPFGKAAILTIDGVGEWATTTIAKGDNTRLSIEKEIHFPHSLGLLYSAFTYYCGFKVNSGEYKLMGLAPYASRKSKKTSHYKRLIEENLIKIYDDGSFVLNMHYFNYATKLTMTNDQAFEQLFKLKRRQDEGPIHDDYFHLAMAVQMVTEDVLLGLAKEAKRITGHENLVLAGGVALNSVANGLLERSGLYQNIWIQPAAGDAGGSLGAALAFYYLQKEAPLKRELECSPDSMKGAYLGPRYSSRDIKEMIHQEKAHAQGYQLDDIVELLQNGQIGGWFQGRMEFGPRALGNRSIIADPRNKGMQQTLNLKIKKRESFRPFAPSILERECSHYYDLKSPGPYMLNVAHALYEREELPAVTHVDGSARVQTVAPKTNPLFAKLLSLFQEKTGVPILINTSFNVRGEPIVCTPRDAYQCFMETEMDFLVLEDQLFLKKEQPDWNNQQRWKRSFSKD